MSMTEYEKAAFLIKAHPDLANFSGPKPESLVVAAEEKLDVKFPSTYRRFLREYGAGSFGSEEIYGVIDENFEESRIPNGIWYTLNERKRYKLPYHLVVIYEPGDGDIFCLDLNSVEKGEALVIAYNSAYPPEEQRKEVIAKDFGEFLLDLTQRQTRKGGT